MFRFVDKADVRRWLWLATLLALVWPAASSGAEGDETKVLRDRVTQYWDARVARSEKVYDFYPVPELGGPKDRKMLGEFGNVTFEGYEIEDISVDGDTATVKLQVVADTSTGSPHHKEHAVHVPSQEEWIRVCDTWFRKPVRKSLVRKDFLPAELGEVGEDGPDCSVLERAGASTGAEDEMERKDDPSAG
jgi:hypothetical protein